MTPTESILRNLGDNKDKQWYQLYPERLAEEIELMNSWFPHIILDYKDGKNVSWTGRVSCHLEDGAELYALEVRIECPRDYPIVFPKVIDVNGVLIDKKCPHLNDDKKTLCYGNRLDPSLDFISGTRIKNVVEYIAVFLGRQWHFERYGYWPHGQLHGIHTFLDHEVKVGRIDPLALCPCALSEKTYKDCHMRGVANILLEMESKLKPEIRSKIVKPERNSPCPCGAKKPDGSAVKFKKCCERNLNFPSSKAFLFLKFPNIFKGRIMQR